MKKEDLSRELYYSLFKYELSKKEVEEIILLEEKEKDYSKLEKDIFFKAQEMYLDLSIFKPRKKEVLLHIIEHSWVYVPWHSHSRYTGLDALKLLLPMLNREELEELLLKEFSFPINEGLLEKIEKNKNNEKK